MAVYIEYVLIDNLVIDYLLLKTTLYVSGVKAPRWRIALSALLGAGVALVFPLIAVHPALLFLIKICVGLLLPLLCAKYKSVKSFYITTALFMGLTFATGGGIIGVYNLLGLDYGNEFCIATIIIPAYAILKFINALVKAVYRRGKTRKNVYPCELILGGITVKTDGLMDTGNSLYDGQNPVIICNREIALKFLDKTLIKMGETEYSTAGGKSKLITIKLTAVKIYFNELPNIIYNVTLGVAKSQIGTGYGVILHPALLGENYAVGNDQTKSAC